ncbi:MAG: helix-turn-helix transcriptional regulator [Candidatus Methylomirabilota bacterium]|jgi:transcriptional regulator with XRE-family HTH domain
MTVKKKINRRGYGQLDLAAVGNRIRERRTALKLSQAELGKLAGGIHVQSISKYERGVRAPLANVVDLSRALGITAYELLTGSPAKDLSGGSEERRRQLMEKALFSITPAGQAPIDYFMTIVPGKLRRDGRLIKAFKELVDILLGPDEDEVKWALGAIEIFAERSRDQFRKRNPVDG